MKTHIRQVRFDPDQDPPLYFEDPTPIKLQSSEDAIVWNLVDKEGEPLYFPPTSQFAAYGLTVAFEGNSLFGPLTVLDQRPFQVVAMGSEGGGVEYFEYRMYFVRRRLDRLDLVPVQFLSRRHQVVRTAELRPFAPLNLEVTSRVLDEKVILEVNEDLVQIFSGQSVSWLFDKKIGEDLGRDYLPQLEFTDFDSGDLTPYGPFQNLSISRLFEEPSDFDFKITGTLSDEPGLFTYNVVALALDNGGRLTVLSESDPQLDDMGPPPTAPGGGDDETF